MKVNIIKLQTTRSEIENTKVKDTEILNDYISKIMKLLNKMKIYGEK